MKTASRSSAPEAPSAGEAEGASPSPVLLCDTRQQAGKHTNVDGWLDAHGIPYEYRKLDFGDYMRADGASNISVDTKQGMAEVASNIGRDHARFVRECVRARDAGFRLVVLVEEHAAYDAGMGRVAGWVPDTCRRCGRCDPRRSVGCRRYRRKPMQGAAALRIMATLTSKYGVLWRFCARTKTARTICDILGVEYEDG